MKEQWTNFRDGLLKLHKSLLEFERKQYEGKHGKVASPGAMLSLLMENAAFAWLRQISELIVGIDELLDSKEQINEQKYKDMLAYCKKLLKPQEHGNSFEKNYYQAVHQDPSVALCHAKAQTALQKISY
jgi:hypothetical protein